MLILSFFTKILHYFPSEMSHNIALKSLKVIHKLGLLRYLVGANPYKLSTSNISSIGKLSSLTNKIGIAAGLDKNGDYIDCLAALGVDFIELGTVTPRAQNGNPKPRLFRNKKDQSLINRLGFNNKGVDYLSNKLEKRKADVVIGSSIGKNYDTPIEKAYEDYLTCMEKIYRLSDYLAVNISSPNTSNLRDLSNSDYLPFLLNSIKNKQLELSNLHGYKPVFIKLSPDETKEHLEEICKTILSIKLDGIICSNTSIDHNHTDGQGGLSGAPLRKKATEQLLKVKELVGNRITLIASGGVMTAADFQEKIDAGADLVQVYTGFIYSGPRLIKDIISLSPK